MDQNLSQYRIFYTVAKSGNISKAAAELYISQPAISKAIRKLEDSLGTPLFLRNSRGVVLTPEGKILFEHVSAAFEAIDRGENELQRIRKLGIAHIRIGVSTTLCKYILLPYLKTFIGDHPHVRITIENQATAETLAMLEQNRIDLGLVAKPHNLKDITFLPVQDVEDIFVAAPSYLKNLRDREGENCDLFNCGTIMLLDQKNMTRLHIDTYLSEHHIEIPQILEVSTMDLVIEFSKIGLGIGCCIKECVRKELEDGTLVQIPMPYPIEKRTIGFALPAGMPQTSAVKEFLKAANPE